MKGGLINQTIIPVVIPGLISLFIQYLLPACINRANVSTKTILLNIKSNVNRGFIDQDRWTLIFMLHVVPVGC